MNGVVLGALILNWVVLAVVAVLVVGILRYLGSIQQRLELQAPRITKFEAGQPISAFTLPELDGRERSSDELIGQGRSTMLLILTTTCSECEAIARQIVELTRRPGGLTRLGWDFS